MFFFIIPAINKFKWQFHLFNYSVTILIVMNNLRLNRNNALAVIYPLLYIQTANHGNEQEMDGRAEHPTKIKM